MHLTLFMVLEPGRPYPLGATYDGSGVNFSLFSSVADLVELCLFDSSGAETRYELPRMTALCWHGYFPGLKPGQEYGFRLHGPWAPGAGLLCNPSKLLLDPYAKCIQGHLEWNEAVFPYFLTGPAGVPNNFDSAPYVPRSVIVDPHFDWDGDQPLRTPWDLTVIYEAHVKGFTMKHPDVPPNLRGTYSGMAHPAITSYLKDLGVTAVELMPVQQFVHDRHLLERGLSNYWGYNTVGFFAPHNEYSSSTAGARQHIQEFKRMVKALHKAGLEVILDVAYGHTAEGNHLGPLLSFKGIDNVAYYRLDDNNPFYYIEYTGTSNSLNIRHPRVLQLVMDSLRYWVTEMHVDGFRFDLASALARGFQEVDQLSALFDVIQQDPVVSQAKLIAEPSKVPHAGYQIGHFPPLWSEWNSKFRDGVRDYWRGTGTLTEFCFRLSGSPDLYQMDRRPLSAGINFVTCHDGLTLVDLVSYSKRNHAANGESSSGREDDRSWNCGAEGLTSDSEVNALRARHQRNLLATLMLSQGVPMLLAGDEIARTQGGNNNAYCLDTEVSWLDWEHADFEIFAFAEKLITLRREHPAFRRRDFADNDIEWYRPDGERMGKDAWNAPWAKTVGVFLDSSSTDDPEGSFYIAFNAHTEPVPFTIPRHLGRFWRVVVDTASNRILPIAKPKGITFYVAAHSLIVIGRLLSMPPITSALDAGIFVIPSKRD